jgi:elongation factor P
VAETVGTNQFKNGMHIEVDNVVYRIVEFQHVKPGKGGAFVRSKLKAAESGKVVEKTFRAGESVTRIITSTNDMQFLYDDGTNVVLMNTETYEQVQLPRESVADEMQWLKEGDVVQLLSLDGRPTSIQLPASVELVVAQTEPGVKGDTVSNVTKPATLETGAVVQVPLFVNEGDRIKVDTREGGRYLNRA